MSEDDLLHEPHSARKPFAEQSMESAIELSVDADPANTQNLLPRNPIEVQREASARKDPHLGVIVGGDYQIARRIGGGGSTVVFEATDLKQARSVALKLLKSDFSS